MDDGAADESPAAEAVPDVDGDVPAEATANVAVDVGESLGVMFGLGSTLFECGSSCGEPKSCWRVLCLC